MTIRIYLLICFSIIYTVILGQYKKLIYIPGKTDVLIDLNGNLVCKIPPKFDLQYSKFFGSFQENVFIDDNEYQYDFHGYPIIVNSRSSNFFGELNERCEVNSIFDTSGDLSKYCDGFYLATKWGKNLSKKKLFVFLDRNADPSFKHLNGFSKAFWFSEGLAPVWIDSIGWVYIDSLGRENNILNDSLRKSEIASPFIKGFALIIKKINVKENENRYLPYLIDKKGKIVLDIGEKINRRFIYGISNFNGEILCILVKDKKNGGRKILMINTSGEIVNIINGDYTCQVTRDGFVVFYSYNSKQNIHTYLVYNKNGQKLSLPEGAQNVKYLDANKFKLILGSNKEGKRFYLYDALENKLVFHHPKDEILGLVENRLILKGINNDIKVINYENNKLLYHSYPDKVEIYDLDEYTGKLEDITIFHCSQDKWVDRIEEMVNLKLLILKSLKIQELPKIGHLRNLPKLIIEDCSKIKKLDLDVKNLTHLLLKSCGSISNVPEFVLNQSQLRVLHILNMNLLLQDKSAVLENFAEANIDGNSFIDLSDFYD